MNPPAIAPSSTAPVDQGATIGVAVAGPVGVVVGAVLGAAAVPHSKLVKVSGAPHGLNVSHAQAFNDAPLSFLRV